MVLLMGTLKNRVEWILNFILRGIMGMFGIYFANMALGAYLPGVSISYNLLTFFVSGVLGLPGLLLMYGIGIYMS